MLLGEVTMTEFARIIAKRATVIIPFGTLEAHGAHLPLDTDTRIIEEVVKAVAASTGVFMAPVVQYGVCTSTGAHPGSIGITPSTLRAIISDIVADAHAKGLRNFILVSGHGGSIHLSAMREAAEALIKILDGAKIAVFCIYDIVADGAAELIETANDSHAGEAETSLVMHLSPELVKSGGREEFPMLPKIFVVKDKVKYWEGAVWGDPSKASADKGKKLFGLMCERLSDVVERIEKTDF